MPLAAFISCCPPLGWGIYHASAPLRILPSVPLFLAVYPVGSTSTPAASAPSAAIYTGEPSTLKATPSFQKPTMVARPHHLQVYL